MTVSSWAFSASGSGSSDTLTTHWESTLVAMPWLLVPIMPIRVLNASGVVNYEMEARN